MRYEFERGETLVASALWEGPAQVSVDVREEDLRPQFDRYFESEVVYLNASPFDSGDDALATRRRDWTPWEFERACRNLAHRLGCEVRRVETGPVETRPEEAPTR